MECRVVSMWKTPMSVLEHTLLLTLRLALVLELSMLCCMVLHWGKCNFPDITAQEGECPKSLLMSLRITDACSRWVSYMEMEVMPYLRTGRRHLWPVSSRSSCFLLVFFLLFVEVPIGSQKSVIRKSTKEVEGQEFKCGMVPRGPFVNSLFPRRMRIMEGGSDKENEEKKKKRMRDQLGSRSGPVGVIETRHFEGKWNQNTYIHA